MSDLRSLGARFALTDQAIDKLKTLLSLVREDPTAPTTIRAERQIIDDHLADSLAGLTVIAAREATLIADIGAGAGFPGLVIAAARPRSRVALVEANGKKCSFLRRAVMECGLENAEVVQSRIEEWAEGRESADLVTARALASLDVVCEYAAPLLRAGGALLAWRGALDLEEDRAAAMAAGVLGLELGSPVQVRPYPNARNRHLQLAIKVESTPPGFPRRAGMAKKRPLGQARAVRSIQPTPLGSDETASDVDPAA